MKATRTAIGTKTRPMITPPQMGCPSSIVYTPFTMSEITSKRKSPKSEKKYNHVYKFVNDSVSPSTRVLILVWSWKPSLGHLREDEEGSRRLIMSMGENLLDIIVNTALGRRQLMLSIPVTVADCNHRCRKWFHWTSSSDVCTDSTSIYDPSSDAGFELVHHCEGDQWHCSF